MIYKVFGDTVVVRLERGVGKVSLDTIVKICNYLNVSIDKIIND